MEAAKEKEDQRRQKLRDHGPAADELLSRIIRAKVELDGIISSSDLFFQADSLEKLRGWSRTHSSLMAFEPFSAVVEEMTEAQGHVLIKEDVEETLNDDNFIELAVDFADSELGIERLWRLVDGMSKSGVPEGGREMETSNGRYEYDYVRYNRLLLSIPGADRGWIYVLVNSAMPGMVKIGHTKKNPEHRAFNLSKDTGVPTAFTVAFCEIVGNCRRIESAAHERLSGVRVNHNREFFRVSVEEAIEVIRSVAKQFT